MTTIESYTPFEAFIIFQLLRVFGSEVSRFSQVSDTVKENEFIKESKEYEPERFSSESLKQLYLEVVKEEARSGRAGSSSPVNDGNRNPRKRKLSSPTINTSEEAAEYDHLLPKLVNKLYSRYRDHATRTIQEEERKIRSLEKDIQEIENGKWDARLHSQENGSRRESKGVSSIQTLLRDDVEDLVRDDGNGKDRPDIGRSQNGAAHSRDSASYADVNGHLRPTTATTENTARVTDINSHHPRTPSASGSHQVSSPNPENYQALSRQSSQSRMDSHAPYLPPIGHVALSPTLEVSRRLPQPPPQMGAPPMASPRLSNSPIILPPPPGMLRSSGSPGGPLDALADMAGQQYRPSSNVKSPRQTQFYNPPPHPNQLPQPRNYMQRSYPYYDSQVPYAQHYPPYAQTPLPPYQSPNQVQYSPHPSPAQQYWSGSRQSAGAPYQSPLPSHAQHPGYQANLRGPTIPSGQAARVLTNNTPQISGNEKRRSQRPSPIDTSMSSTKWKRVDLLGSSIAPGSPTPPGPDAVSPISEQSFSPLLETSEVQARSSRGRFKGQKSHNEFTAERATNLNHKASKTGRRGGRTRGETSRGRGARRGSNASSPLGGSLRTRTRSVSIASQTDAILPQDKRSSTRKIKPEPPATPATALDDTSRTTTPLPDPSRTSGRFRRDTLKGSEVRPTIKRKRGSTIEATPEPLPSTAAHNPTQVLASRNFPRTSAPIMNEITAHKLASMFAKPLTEREAPGYKDLIYRPQDLKSIKSAIGAGSRAVAAAEEAAGEAGGKEGRVWLDKTPEVQPPKGIVNSAQLEKEVCRIFANAVMFNPDPKRGLGPAFRTRAKRAARGMSSEEEEEVGEEEDGGGVVRDTREMFAAVEKSVGNWRAAERTGESGARSRVGEGGQEEVEETGDEESSGGPAKRRRRI